MGPILLHSPLVGPGCWASVAGLTGGTAVALPRLIDLEPPYYPKLAEAVAKDAAGRVLVVHSAAGVLVPAIAALCDMAGVVFCDSVLPSPGAAWIEEAPDSLRDLILGLAEAGTLPPWSRWWPPGALRRIVPDEAMFAAFEADLSPTPLAYSKEPAPNLELPKDLPCAYLRMSAIYEAEEAQATAWGWPTRRLDLHHLAMLTDPGAVAAGVMNLAERMAPAHA